MEEKERDRGQMKGQNEHRERDTHWPQTPLSLEHLRLISVVRLI